MNAPKTSVIMVERVCDHIHGSGVNGEWSVYQARNGKYVWCENYFEPMDSLGYYAGVVNFRIGFPVGERMTGFVLQFEGDMSHRLAKRYQLREYIEGMVAMKVCDLDLQMRA